MDEKTTELVAELIEDMRSIFGDDRRRIEHALAVLAYANQIRVVEGGDARVIQAAAILHDIGIHEAERKHGSPAGRYQEIEGPPIAEGILRKRGLDEERIAHVCRIIANHHSARNIDTLEFRVLWDADWLVNLPEVFEKDGGIDRRSRIDRIFKTSMGRQIALRLFVGSQHDVP
ncbi:MAG: HD domain-containing protein [Sedimentisphaerales bacterium]|nr:HD domain-containing protein [Sedimentisphaerales bacterium]